MAVTTTINPGPTSTEMDDLGEVLTSTDADGHTLAYTYDALGRKTGEYDGSTAGTQLAAWTYDTLQAGQPTASTSQTPIHTPSLCRPREQTPRLAPASLMDSSYSPRIWRQSDTSSNAVDKSSSAAPPSVRASRTSQPQLACRPHFKSVLSFAQRLQMESVELLDSRRQQRLQQIPQGRPHEDGAPRADSSPLKLMRLVGLFGLQLER